MLELSVYTLEQAHSLTANMCFSILPVQNRDYVCSPEKGRSDFQKCISTPQPSLHWPRVVEGKGNFPWIILLLWCPASPE